MVLLNLLNAELSLKRYWWVPRPQEVEKERDYTWHYTVTTRMMPAWAAMSHFNVSLTVRRRVTRQ